MDIYLLMNVAATVIMHFINFVIDFLLLLKMCVFLW